MNKVKLNINEPSGDIGFVEYKRSFAVEGTIDGNIIDDSYLLIRLVDLDGNVLRYVYSSKKNQEIDRYYKNLTCYKEELDPNRQLMQSYGFPLLIKDNSGSLNNACVKAFYNDNQFKAVIVSSSDTKHGSLWPSDFDLYDEDNNPYDLLPKGEYIIEVSFSKGNNIYAFASKKIIIGERDNQIICRFNPLSHKTRMIDWCNSQHYAIIKDLLPGYLDAYLGKWYYHMGLLKTYRANDICLYEKAHIRMFIYLIDETSTSYSSELSYLQQHSILNDEKRFTAYCYDIGEALINDTKANIIEFSKDDYMHIYRVDVVKNAKENEYYIDQRNVIRNILDINNIEVYAGEDIAIAGVVKPIQLDCDDFILKDDNTYEIHNSISVIRYTLKINDETICFDRSLNMERIDEESLGKSVYEFYNIIHIENKWSNSIIEMKIEVLDMKQNYLQANQELVIKVK